MSSYGTWAPGDPVRVVSLEDFGPQDRGDWRLAKTDVGDAHVSTVFLGLDHQHGEEGPPLWFETLVFGGDLDDEMSRYTTEAEARAGHAAMVARVRRASRRRRAVGALRVVGAVIVVALALVGVYALVTW